MIGNKPTAKKDSRTIVFWGTIHRIIARVTLRCCQRSPNRRCCLSFFERRTLCELCCALCVLVCVSVQYLNFFGKRPRFLIPRFAVFFFRLFRRAKYPSSSSSWFLFCRPGAPDTFRRRPESPRTSFTLCSTTTPAIPTHNTCSSTRTSRNSRSWIVSFRRRCQRPRPAAAVVAPAAATTTTVPRRKRDGDRS